MKDLHILTTALTINLIFASMPVLAEEALTPSGALPSGFVGICCQDQSRQPVT